MYNQNNIRGLLTSVLSVIAILFVKLKVQTVKTSYRNTGSNADCVNIEKGTAGKEVGGFCHEMTLRNG